MTRLLGTNQRLAQSLASQRLSHSKGSWRGMGEYTRSCVPSAWSRMAGLDRFFFITWRIRTGGGSAWGGRPREGDQSTLKV